ncbi:MAG: phosphoglucosamine mutase [Phycisphaeraceae bacterium]
MAIAPLMLGVSGLRGLIGQSLTPVVAARYGAAVGQWFMDQRGRFDDGDAAHVVVGRDSRPSGAMIESAAVAGLLGAGCRVTTLGIATTPGVAVMVDHLNASGGVVITASHNPIMWNGIKTLRRDGAAPPPQEAQQIVAGFQADSAKWAPVEKLAGLENDPGAARVHVDRVLRHVDADVVRHRKLKVVLDSVHGAGGPSGALLLRELGVEVVHLYGEPTGRFPHTPEPTKANLTELADAVRDHHADAGFAQDPDADRLAIVDEKGTYIGEEYTLALCSLHVLSSQDPPVKGGVLATNLSTSRMIDDVAAKFACRVIRTPVGEANVAAAMREHNAIAGGEGNGGIIWPKVVHVRDSLSGIALVVEMLAQRGVPLSAIVEASPRYAMVKDKVDLKPGMKERLAPELCQAFAQQTLDLQDGVRIDWPDRWVHVRTSNTEPIMRLIAEAGDEGAARELIAQVRKALKL